MPKIEFNGLFRQGPTLMEGEPLDKARCYICLTSSDGKDFRVPISEKWHTRLLKEMK